MQARCQDTFSADIRDVARALAFVKSADKARDDSKWMADTFKILLCVGTLTLIPGSLVKPNAGKY